MLPGKYLFRVFRIVATLLVAFALAAFTQQENQRLRVPWLNVGPKTSHVIHTFRSLGLRPSHGSSILLLLKENLFQNKWNVFFIASLVWNDHSLRIWVENVNELTPQQQANVDYIISVSEFDADVIRAPRASKVGLSGQPGLCELLVFTTESNLPLMNQSIVRQWIAMPGWLAGWLWRAVMLVLVLIQITSLHHKGLTTDEPLHYQYGYRVLNGAPERTASLNSSTMPFSSLHAMTSDNLAVLARMAGTSIDTSW